MHGEKKQHKHGSSKKQAKGEFRKGSGIVIKNCLSLSVWFAISALPLPQIIIKKKNILLRDFNAFSLMLMF